MPPLRVFPSSRLFRLFFTHFTFFLQTSRRFLHFTVPVVSPWQHDQLSCEVRVCVFTFSGKKTARSRAELTEPSRDRRERAQRLSQYFFRSVSVRVARTGSSSRDNSEEKKERGSSRWWRGGSMPRGALFCPLWRPPACPPRIPADRSEY